MYSVNLVAKIVVLFDFLMDKRHDAKHSKTRCDWIYVNYLMTKYQLLWEMNFFSCPNL